VLHRSPQRLGVPRRLVADRARHGVALAQGGDPGAHVLAVDVVVLGQIAVDERHEVGGGGADAVQRRAVQERVRGHDLACAQLQPTVRELEDGAHRVVSARPVAERRAALRRLDDVHEVVPQVADVDGVRYAVGAALGPRVIRVAERGVTRQRRVVRTQHERLQLGVVLAAARFGIVLGVHALPEPELVDGVAERRVPLGLDARQVGLQRVVHTRSEVVHDGPHLALPVGDPGHLGLVGHRQLRARLLAPPHLAQHLAPLVALEGPLPQVVAVRPEHLVRLGDRVRPVVVQPLHAEEAEGLHPAVVVGESLVVTGVVHPEQRGVHHDLAGLAVQRGLPVEQAHRDRAVPGQRHAVRLGGHQAVQLDRVDDAVAVAVVEPRGVGLARVRHVHVGELGFDAHVPEAAPRVVPRPVDAHVVPLVPGSLDVLLDDVGLLARHPVVGTPDVEVLLDPVGQHHGALEGAVLQRGLGVGDVLVRASAEQPLLLDVPGDPVHLTLQADEYRAVAVGHVHDRVAHVPLAREGLLGHGVRLHRVDRRGRAAHQGRRQRGPHPCSLHVPSP
jgi:hypothetical protein